MPQGISLDADSVIAEAVARTGLSDFGKWQFRESMKRLLQSLDTEARLHTDGRAAYRHKVVDILCTRLYLEHLVSLHPEIVEERIDNPVVIVGLPRTGTTMLQRMLAADNRFYSTAYWEARFPVPAGTVDQLGPLDPRIARVKDEVREMLEIMPDLAAIHPLDAEAADEEVSLLEQSFYSTNPESMADVPAYGEWLAEQDQTEAYEYLKRLLQCLQWQKKQRGEFRERWILKTPHHIHWMDVLFRVFPDARVIQTHRDPLETIPSLASLIYRFKQIFSDHVDPTVIGRDWSAKMAAGMIRCMDIRASLPGDRFLDIYFADTVKQPMTTLETIYAFLGMELTTSARRAIEHWRENNRREARASHDYSPAQFGLTEDQLERDYAEYRTRYIHPATGDRK